MASEIKVDTISEKTSAGGVTIDGLLIKDGGISGDVSLIGTTPTFTIGDAGAEDAALVFDGNAQDFYIALDDSADDLVIGLGSTVGTTPILSFTEGGAATFKNVGTGDDNPMLLTLQTAETDMAANDIIGAIQFQAPDEGTGTDAILVSAAIKAYAEGDHSSSSNATTLGFYTGASEAAAIKMTLSSGGNLDVTGDITGSTINADGDTSSGDNAAIGYTAGEGLILTGQGSTSDVTVKNDADTTVFTIPTGTDDILFPDNAKAMWGAGSDLQIYHDASNSYIKDNATGSLILEYSEIIFNESGADADFRVEGSGNANLFKIDAGANLVGIGSAPDQGEASASLHIKRSDSGATVNSNGDNLIIEGASTDVGMSFFTHTGGACNIMFGDSGDNDIGRIVYEHSSDFMGFTTNGSERMRIQSDGTMLVGKTGNDDTVAGSVLPSPGNFAAFTSTTNPSIMANRHSDDGTIIDLRNANTSEGTISVSGSTIAYNTFCGTHWSRLADNSKPTILRGTVMESIATMIDWYQAVAEVAEATDSNGSVTPAHLVMENIALPNGKSAGDAVTFTSKGKEYTGIYVKEDNEQLPMCKISDTEDSKAIYGVFMAWDDADDGLDGDVNDMYVAALGAFVVRINSGETVAIGDYLQSNGDGTAKKQADDILRASTIGKVTSTTKTHIHADGSYCVPCTLHCG